METKIIINSEQWTGWLKNNSRYDSFTQAWAWGDVLLAEGKNVERLAVVEGGEVLAQAQIIYSQLTFGWQYAFCPKGPMMGNYEITKLKEIYDAFVDYFKKNKVVVFLRVEPQSFNFPISQFPNFKKTIDINPSATLILDLSKTEEEILAGMHQKTRYNIHLAEKKDLKISQEKNLEVFWVLMNKTGSRDKFDLHHKKHYEKGLQSPMVYQLTVYEDKIPVACAVFACFANTFTYLYGASDYEYRHLMAPYLLQWEGIKIGKSLGCRWYDFFGVAPVIDGNYDLHHQYAGVTKFKLGFGGIPQQSAGTWDAVIDGKKYMIYNFLRKLRRLV